MAIASHLFIQLTNLKFWLSALGVPYHLTLEDRHITLVNVPMLPPLAIFDNTDSYSTHVGTVLNNIKVRFAANMN